MTHRRFISGNVNDLVRVGQVDVEMADDLVLAGQRNRKIEIVGRDFWKQTVNGEPKHELGRLIPAG